MTNSSPSSSPPISSSPGDAKTGIPSTLDPGDASRGEVDAEGGENDPRDVMRGGVHGGEVHGGEVNEPRDATRGGGNDPASPGHSPIGGTSPLSIDLSGELCPFTFVRAKLALEELPIGAVLRVIVDHEPATRNIPRSATEWGQEVIAVASLSPRTWAIDLRKRVR